MLELYHFGGAICAQKVRIALSEKGVGWVSREVPTGDAEGGLRSAEYLRLNPNGVVPTLVHDGHVLIESRIISEYVEEAFDGPALLSTKPAARHAARLWSKQIDDNLHLHIFVLSFMVIFRARYLDLPRERWDTALPGLRDPLKRTVTIDLLEQGYLSPYVRFAISRFDRMAKEMDEALSAAAWLAGPEYSLADADYTAYVYRLDELGMSWLWSERPHLRAWWDRVRARKSFARGILDWLQPGEADGKSSAAQAAAPALRAAAA